MTVTAQKGYIGFALQAAKLGSTDVTTSTYFQSVQWERHRATMFDLGPIEMVDSLPPEIGSGLFPITGFKNGAYVGGAMSVEARLAGGIGNLLAAASGATVTSASGTGTNKAHTHIFQPDPTDHTLMKWLSMKKYLPATTTALGKTEFLVDCRVPQAVVTIPQMGPARMDYNFVGRKFTGRTGDYTGNSTGGTNKAFESGLSIGLSRLGSAVIDSAILPASGCTFVGAVITLTNNFTTPQQEMIIGSQYPDDFAVLTRSAQITLTYKWPDASLYSLLRYGSGYEFRTDIVYGDVTVSTVSASAIGGGSSVIDPYSLTFYAPKVGWQMANPRLAAGEAIFVDLIGTIYDAEDGSAPWRFTLANEVVSY